MQNGFYDETTENKQQQNAEEDDAPNTAAAHCSDECNENRDGKEPSRYQTNKLAKVDQNFDHQRWDDDPATRCPLRLLQDKTHQIFVSLSRMSRGDFGQHQRQDCSHDEIDSHGENEEEG